MKFSSPPLPGTSFAPRLGFCIVGIVSSSLMVGAELSKPFAKYLSISVMWSCRGTPQLVTSAPRLRFTFGKASAAVTLVGRLKYSEVLPPPFHLLPLSWSSSPCSVTATPTPPLPTTPARTLLPPFPRSTFGRYIKTRLSYARPPGHR